MRCGTPSSAHTNAMEIASRLHRRRGGHACAMLILVELNDTLSLCCALVGMRQSRHGPSDSFVLAWLLPWGIE